MAKTRRQPWLVPEVIQSSAMDCGPAALKALLEGHGVGVGYGRLREACQTDVDGTSIDSLETVAVQLGLRAEQVMVPVDHLLLPAAHMLPCLLVVRLADGNTHFVVAWRKIGPWVEVMDPATGRRWPVESRFLAQCYVHTHRVPAAAWRRWAESDEFRLPLFERMGRVGVPRGRAGELWSRALEDRGWLGIAGLDAATRLARRLVEAGAFRPKEAGRLLPSLVESTAEGGTGTVTEACWSVRPPEGGSAGPESTELVLRGAVAVRVLGMRGDAPAEAEGGDDVAPPPDSRSLPPELVAALEEEPPSAAKELLRLLRADGWTSPLVLASATAVAAGLVLLEALVLRGLLDLGLALGSTTSRLVGGVLLVLLFALGLGLRKPILEGSLRLGRQLEIRLRATLLEKIPRLAHRYFKSRLVSDMAERGHAVHRLRQLPILGQSLIQASLQLVFTTVGIAVLDPASAPLAVFAAVVCLGVPLLAHPVLAERDLRLRSHSGALSRFYLDGLLGLGALRSHGAETALRREHESLLKEWRGASFDLLRASVVAQGAQSLLGFLLAAWLLTDHLGRAGTSGGVLLLVYWALQLPNLGRQVAMAARQYPMIRSIVLRLMEPLTAPEDEPLLGTAEESADGARTPLAPSSDNDASDNDASDDDASDDLRGVEVELRNVSVRAGGHVILRDVDLRLEPGEHVAVVGPSGAGKSTLVGLLLGWHRPMAGEVRVDGAPLDAAALEALRQEAAWVDPAVQLWNRSLFHNLRYATAAGGAPGLPLDELLAESDLDAVLAKLPEGLRTPLGEGGALVSGGEGQRVRLGRALFTPGTRLAVLDEPFRGLDRDTRRTLLARTRRLWSSSTLLCVTHDVDDVDVFPRILVVEDGRVVEDGAPAELLARPDSRYGALLAAELEVRKLWGGKGWRRLRAESGDVAEAPRGAGR